MHIALGISGCIAAYKAAIIIREIQRKGIRDISVIMTESAQKFITPLTFEALTNRRVITGMWERTESREISHVSLARRVDLLLVAPASADIIGKFASGIADDFLSTFYMALDKPVVIAPTMNREMWAHPQVQENVEKLKNKGDVIVEPESGYLACGEEGVGRLASAEKIVEEVLKILAENRPLLGKRFVITAGATREHIDAVRFLSNPSSGKMGYALAEAAARMGADVTLISGAAQIPAPENLKRIDVVTADQMANAVTDAVKSADVLIMAAAVADFKPKKSHSSKIKKNKMAHSIEIEPTGDILKSMKGSGGFIKVGFAAESDDIIENAKLKLKDKELDIIVANDISRADTGFASDTNEITIIDRGGFQKKYDLMSKTEAAEVILKHIIKLLSNKNK